LRTNRSASNDSAGQLEIVVDCAKDFANLCEAGDTLVCIFSQQTIYKALKGLEVVR
jgi:hypothetical protein